MRITFQLRFHTEPGQNLLLSGNHPILGNAILEQAIPLRYLNDQFWHVTLELPPGSVPDAELRYHYILRNPDGSVVHDWGDDKVLNPADCAGEEILVIDSWNSASYYENAFFTEPFQQVLLKPNHSEVRLASPERATHIFKVKAPLLAKGQTLCLVGSTEALGNWSTAKPLLLNRGEEDSYLTAEVDLSRTVFPVAYKYGVYDAERDTFIRHEGGNNRFLYDHIVPRKQTVVNDGFAALPSTFWKGAGVAIPVFSLRSNKSFGVGEFADLMPLVDWCKRTGLKLIQVLPINDTIATHTWMDSYPYSAISAFALHPLYLRLERMTDKENKPLLKALEPERQKLNALPHLDYEAVINTKLAFVKKLYELQKTTTFATAEFKAFFEENKHWLMPYSAFCYLRDKYGTADFNQWPASRNARADELPALTDESAASSHGVALHSFIQFHLHLQLREAASYAHQNGVILKGDIAIGVYRHGADVWQEPELYHTDAQAGAPPDPFSATGQNWEFPTYNWARMKQDGYAWWKQRFEQMSHYFDAFRIDHILGFFRIWSIPLHAVQGILGYFVPVIPIQLDEFASRGIRFEANRFLKPYITDAVVSEIFGAESPAVTTKFLDRDGSDNYSLKPEFATQRQVEKHFAAREQTPENKKLKLGLYDLISNVILFETEGGKGGQFHFRFSMENTSSFRHFDSATQQQLRDLYIDYFFRRQDVFWMKQALEKLPALKRSTNMLICGEDLGLVPACVPDVMKQLGLLSLEIQRMPKQMNREFSRPQEAPYLSVVTPSTHDMSTIRGWWKEDRNLTQKFYNQELGQAGSAPVECEPWVNKAVVLQHLASPAMWSIFQLQDLFGIEPSLRREPPEDERINIPANPKHYWRYRMHVPLESLLKNDVFNEELKRLVVENGR